MCIRDSCDTWDKAMRELAAKNLTELANNWLSQDEENPRNPETDPISEEELALSLIHIYGLR